MRKKQVLSQAGGVNSWRSKVESGTIFHDLNGLESKEKTSLKMRRQRELASISEPSRHKEEKQLRVVMSRAEHAADSQSALAGMEAMVSRHMAEDTAVEKSKVRDMGLGGKSVDLHALRRASAAKEPKYAGKANQPHFASVVPHMDGHVVALEKYIGGSKARGSSSSAGGGAARKAAAPVRKSQLTQVESEIASFRRAAHEDVKRERAATAAHWSDGAKEAARVQDRFSASNSDAAQGARGTMNRAVDKFA